MADTKSDKYCREYCRDEGMTVLELILIIAAAFIIVYVLLGAVSSNTPSESAAGNAPGGIIGDFESSLENVLVRNGPSYGMQDISGNLYDVDIYSYGVHPDELGSAAVSIKLVAMSGERIDFNSADLVFKYGNDTEWLTYSAEQPLTPGHWVIVERGSVIPFHKANGDDILENNEMFTLVANPAITVPANGVFELTLNTNTNRAFDMKFGVPPEIREYNVVKLLV
ncbi:MAG: hypothetical protein II893_04090 [Methanomicrobium sp.]|nr:hypothetical protein [Methanomicrobium sp.]